MDTAEAYRACEEITWSQARNFAYGIRLLPAGKRHALAALYAFARRIDDIGDGTMPPAAKLAALEEARSEALGLASAGSGALASDPVLAALADAGQRVHPNAGVRRAHRRLHRRRQRRRLRHVR